MRHPLKLCVPLLALSFASWGYVDGHYSATCTRCLQHAYIHAEKVIQIAP